MFKYHCLNPISAVGMNKLDENYVKTENAGEADVILVRSAKMHLQRKELLYLIHLEQMRMV